jgi:hypothetical protein
VAGTVGSNEALALMPVCAVHGCPTILGTSGLCDTHRREKDRQRGSRQARGYDTRHEQERARLAPIVARGKTLCAKCGHTIHSREPWDLGHTDDRTAWTGPEHLRCNRQAAGRKAHT